MSELAVAPADVLVVGGGMAGAIAAITARAHGLDVLLVDRGFFGRSGCSALASGMFSYYKPGDDMDYWLSNHGGPLVNRAHLAEAIQLQYELVQDLDRWGVRWVKEHGEIARHGGPGIPFPHSAMMAGGGPQLMMAVRGEALRRGVRVLDRVLLTDLLTADGQHPTSAGVVGAVGFHTRTGDLVQIAAKATVLATGPMHFPYPRPDSPFTGMPIELSGDGVAMAYRVGAELGKMETGGDGLVQALFHCAQGFEMLLGLGGKMYNALGEDFLRRYQETRIGGTVARRSSLAGAGTFEIEHGRGPIYRDNREMIPADVQLCDKVIPIIMRTFEAAGIQVDRDRVPYNKGVVGSAAVSGAGLRINGRAEASLPGLYGAGNTTDGAYVVMAQNLSTCAVMGHWAGNAVPDYVARAPAPRPHADQVARLHAEILAPRERPPGPSYPEIHGRLERLLLDLGHVLTDQKLAAAMDELTEIQQRALPGLRAEDPHGLTKVHGLRGFCDALGVALPVMRHRTESRGNVLRADYPYTDNEQWLKWTVAWRAADGLRLRDVPVPESRDYDLPPRRRVPHPFFAPVGG